MTTPTRSGFSRSVSIPLSATAKRAAPTPNWVARPMILRNLRCSPGRNGATSKSGTSAAIRTGCPDASKLRMGPTPLRPLMQADQKGVLPTPLGATTPSPVTTTLRMASFVSRSRWRRSLAEDALKIESVTVTVASQPGHNRNRAPGWARLLETGQPVFRLTWLFDQYLLFYLVFSNLPEYAFVNQAAEGVEPVGFCCVCGVFAA